MAFGAATLQGNNNTTVSQTTLKISSLTIAVGTVVAVYGTIVSSSAIGTTTVTDDGGNSYTMATPTNRAAANLFGLVAVGFISTALSNQAITLTVNSAWATGATIAAISWAGSSSVAWEDTAARTNTNAAATTSPTITCNAPLGPGELYICSYSSVGSTGDTYTNDSGHGWTAGYSHIGNASMNLSAVYQIKNSGGTVINNPTTTSRGYVMVSTATRTFAAGQQAIYQAVNRAGTY